MSHFTFNKRDQVTKRQKEEQNCEIEVFFSFWKTIVFKVMKAIVYLLKSEHWLMYSSMKSQSNRFIVQEIEYDQKDKVKMTIKDKIKNFNLILRESIVEVVKNHNLYL